MRDISTAKALVQKWTGIFGFVSPETVLSIVGTESSFNPNISNHSERAEARGGAWGYMQMTLDTARDIIARLRPPISTNVSVRSTLLQWHGQGQDLLHPDLNIMLGTLYLSQLAKEFHDFDLVVAAYQQGPANIRRQVAAGVPKNKIIAGLPPHGAAYVVAANDWRKRLAESTV